MEFCSGWWIACKSAIYPSLPQEATARFPSGLELALPHLTRLEHPCPRRLVSFIVTVCLSLINIGSTEALNTINSLSGGSILFSYTITISCLVWRRLFGAPLPPRRWSLGRFGLLINVVALCFIMPVLFFYYWPLYTPVTPVNMNWSSAVFGGVLVFAAVWYVIKARHVYSGPVTLVKRVD
jgi:choline transport protein